MCSVEKICSKQVLNIHTVSSTALQQKILSELIKPSIPQFLQYLEDEKRSFGAGKKTNVFLEDIWTHECIKNVQNLCKPVLYPVQLSKLLDTE